MLRIGIDTGGTFTDFVLLGDGQMTVFKIPSTPAEPEKAVLEGVRRAADGEEGFLLQHGSTVATNAFLERKGAKCVLVTNQGFEDILEIGRQNRPDLFSLQASRPEPLVPQKQRIGIRERTLWDGSSLVPLEKKSLDWLKGKISQIKPESIAVVLLYSYLVPENELKIYEVLQEFDLPVSLSHQILPEFREFERTSTTVLNAYVQPIMARYLSALSEDEMVRRGRLTIMQSNGGSMSAESAAREPVRTLFSGPAGGVVGAFEVARQAGFDRIITLDMGGTSTDVCLCDGKIETTNEAQIDHHPVSTQMIGIHSVGAGGGSIAWVDQGGLLKVGPESAGADPGPICYGKGDQVTVTDAHVFLGHIDPDFFLGGEMKLQPAQVPSSLEKLGQKLAGKEEGAWRPAEIAEGILRIVNSQMEKAIRITSLQKGHDTREFTLVTYGGAGALHACDLARALMIPRILVPQNPGALSALGILRADVIQDSSVTSMVTTEEDGFARVLDEQFQRLDADLLEKMAEEGFEADSVSLEKTVDARYLGQSYELSVPHGEDLIEDFHQRHEQVYGYANRGLPVEIVNLRARARARYGLPPLPEYELEGEEPPLTAMIQEKQMEKAGEPLHLRFYLRSSLRAGNRIPGPAVILEYSATTLIPSDFEARIDRLLNIVIEPRTER